MCTHNKHSSFTRNKLLFVQSKTLLNKLLNLQVIYATQSENIEKKLSISTTLFFLSLCCELMSYGTTVLYIKTHLKNNKN